jgi:hypothetical protein
MTIFGRQVLLTACFAMLTGTVLAQTPAPAPAPAPAQQPATATTPDASPSYDQLSTEAKKAEDAQDAGKDGKAPTGKGKGKPVPVACVPPAPGSPDAPPIKRDEKGDIIKPVYDKHCHLKKTKEKPPKLVPVNIVHGELTVDGLIAKAGLNFQILDFHYLYIWVPGLGTTVVSNHFFPGSTLEENALDGNVITIKIDTHQIQVASEQPLLPGKNRKQIKPLNLFVGLDTAYTKETVYPELGYGDVAKAPYSWPGVLADSHPNVKAPPLPDNLKQKTQSTKVCDKLPDGTKSCHDVEVPLITGKAS